MKNNTNSMYVICLVACLMALLNIDYSSIATLDIVVIIVVIIAIISIVYNYITNRKRNS